MIDLKARSSAMAPNAGMNGNGDSRRASGRWRMRSAIILLPPALAAAVLPAVASASPASVARGRRLAEGHCKACHTIAGRRPSPLAGAPPFAGLEQLHPDRSLDEIVAQGVTSPHPPMPRFLGAADQHHDLLDYVRSVQAAPPPR